MNIDFFTYLIYTLILIWLVIPVGKFRYVGFSYQDVPEGKFVKVSLAFILTYSLLIGLRYNVGTDYENYLEWFKQLRAAGVYPVDNSDVGFLFLNKLLIILEAHYSFLFIIIAFLQIYFLTKSLKDISFIASWYFFFFATTLIMFFSMNVMRQTISYFIFFYTLTLFERKKYVQLVLFLILGFSIHKSIVIIAWVYPLLRFDWYKNKFIQLILLTVTLIFGNDILAFLISDFAKYTISFGYNGYVENVDQFNLLTKELEKGAKLGQYFFYIIYVIIIFYSSNLKMRFQKYNFRAYYNLFFTGAIFEPVVSSNYIFDRTNEYFSNFKAVVLAFLCFYLANLATGKIRVIILGIIIAGCLAFFYRAIYSASGLCAPFQFIFEQ